MFRLRALYPYPLRVFHCGAVCRDQVMAQLLTCTAEDHVFSVVGKNKAELTDFHVSCAMRMLWDFQKERPERLRTCELIKNHPEFLTLRFLAENKISVMKDGTLVEMLYSLCRLKVEHHDPLVQQLTIEGWNRLERFSMARLARFSQRLCEQNLHNSPPMSQITEIVNQNLDSIEDASVLTTFMLTIAGLVSPRLRDALIEKAGILLDSMDPFHYKNPLQILNFFRIVKYTHQPLLEKCNHILLQNVPLMDAGDIRKVSIAYMSIFCKYGEFRLAAKQRLTELLDTNNNRVPFEDLPVLWGPLTGHAFRERKMLENAALLMPDELNAHQALELLKTLVENQCRNRQLMDKLVSALQRNLEAYESSYISKITQILILMDYENPEFFSRLKDKLLLYLQYSVRPHEVSMLTRTLAMLPSPCMDEVLISRIDAMLPQCNLKSLSSFNSSIAIWMRSDPTYYSMTPSKYVHILQTLNRCGQERLQKADQLDIMMKELKTISPKWFEETLLEDTVAMLQRLVNQLSWSNVPDVARFLTTRNIRCTPVLDCIANVAIENMHKIHYSAIDDILSPFAFLNYNSSRVDELFDTCIQHFTPHIKSTDRCLLVEMAYTLAVSNSFPEEVIREIFSVDFLAKLGAELETHLDQLNMDVSMKLMKLNRAVCLECPEFQVPWFHEHFCKQLQRKNRVLVTPIHKQIHKMLGEVLGGINCARAAVLTPYFYTVDFECVLDHRNQAVPYGELSQLQMTNRKVHWDSGSADKERKELLLGYRRIALDFLNYKSYCNHSQHVKGEVLMRKRHLEILGYHVLQIPHFEWNSMEFSSEKARKEYLREKLFTEQA